MGRRAGAGVWHRIDVVLCRVTERTRHGAGAVLGLLPIHWGKRSDTREFSCSSEIPDYVHDAGRRRRAVPCDRIGQSLTARTLTSASAIPASPKICEPVDAPTYGI